MYMHTNRQVDAAQGRAPYGGQYMAHSGIYYPRHTHIGLVRPGSGPTESTLLCTYPSEISMQLR